jgi:hypothetical protein
MTTFSQLIDELALELVRPDLLSMLPAYLNQTIREIHTKSDTQMPVMYPDNRLEDRLVLSGMGSSVSYLWTIPKMAQFQQIEAVYYESIGRYARMRGPKANQVQNPNDQLGSYYWYRTGPQVLLNRPGADGNGVRICWHEYPRSLVYYAAANQPVRWDPVAQEYVWNPTWTGTAQEALDACTNWVLERHEEMLKEGVRAKAYKRIADVERSRLSYSQYESMKAAVINTESIDMTVNYGG